jgi:hypothetical protein
MFERTENQWLKIAASMPIVSAGQTAAIRVHGASFGNKKAPLLAERGFLQNHAETRVGKFRK